MKTKSIIFAFLILYCGPSEVEIQAKIDEAVSNALESTTTSTLKVETTSTTINVIFDGYLEDGLYKDGSRLFISEQDALDKSTELGCPYGGEAKPTIYKVKNHEYTGRLVYESSCIKLTYEELASFVREVYSTACIRDVRESNIRYYYDKFMNKDMPNTYYVMKNTIEKDLKELIESCENSKIDAQMEIDILNMIYGSVEKQENTSTLPEENNSESINSIELDEYELANCQKIGENYTQCTKYKNNQPISVIYCVNGFCKEEY